MKVFTWFFIIYFMTLLHVNILNPEHANIETRRHDRLISPSSLSILQNTQRDKGLLRENKITKRKYDFSFKYPNIPYFTVYTVINRSIFIRVEFMGRWTWVWRSEDLKPGYWVFSIYSIHSINISYYCNAQFYSTVTNSDFCDFPKRWAQRELLPSKNSAEVKTFNGKELKYIKYMLQN